MKKIKDIFIKYEEIIRYLFIGVLSTTVSLSTYYLLVFTLLDPTVPIELQIANLISWLTSATFAYFANRIYVFKIKSKYTLREILCFYLSRISTLLVDMLLMYILVSELQYNDKIIKLIIQIIIIFLNYILSKFIVFKTNKK